jgi:hypothetical protein
MSKNIPTKRIGGKHSLPWFTHEAKHLLRRKKRAYRRAKRSKSIRRTMTGSTTDTCGRPSNRSYVEPIGITLTAYLISPRTYIKAKKQENVGVSTLKAGGKIITDANGKATTLNDQFTSVFTREDMNNISDKGLSPYPSMPPIRITRQGVKKLLDNIKAKKATGPDGIPARVLKEAAEPLSPILATIFQQSIDTGSVPDDWREANVTPIFKKGSNSTPANYRPVSLTSISCKILEHIVVVTSWTI